MTINETTYCPLSQEEMSKELGVTRMTVSNILKKLEKEKLITVESPRKYIIGKEASEIIKRIEKI